MLQTALCRYYFPTLPGLKPTLSKDRTMTTTTKLGKNTSTVDFGMKDLIGHRRVRHLTCEGNKPNCVSIMVAVALGSFMV